MYRHFSVIAERIKASRSALARPVLNIERGVEIPRINSFLTIRAPKQQ